MPAMITFPLFRSVQVGDIKLENIPVSVTIPSDEVFGLRLLINYYSGGQYVE